MISSEKQFPRIVSFLFLFAVLLIFAPLYTAQSEASFEPAECTITVPEGATVECGYTIVPEDRSGDVSDTIRLYTTIYRSSAENPAPDPVIFLQGGPGGGVAELFPNFYDVYIAPITAERDLIVFDQRGTGLSQPALNCRELTEFTIETLETLLTDDELLAGSLEALTACRDRLISQGVNIPAYTSAENAADVADLAAVLGYEQVNLYGGSYGTRLALTVMRDFPNLVRSAVLDGVVPPQMNLLNEQGFKSQRSLDLLFASCAADAECSAAYPDLETAFYDLVAQFDAEPVIVTITSPTDALTYDVPVDGKTLVSALFFSFQVSSLIPALPQTIYDVRDSDTSGLVFPLTIPLILGESVNVGMLLSVTCHEEVYATTPEAIMEDNSAYEGVAAFALAAVYGGDGFFAICDAWGAAPLNPIEIEPVTSDIPTLLLNGEYDPATPPDFGAVAMETLSNSYSYEFPGLGHAESINGGCPLTIALQFLSDPTVEPDSTCIAEMPGVKFLTPDAVSEPVEVTLVEFSSDQLGVSGLLPEGWTEAAPGVYARGASLTDQTALLIQTVPGSPDDFLATLLTQFGITETPAVTATREANGLTWSQYELTFMGLSLDVAMAGTEDTAFAVVLVSSEADRQGLYDAVFIPVIDALFPAQ